MKNGFLILTAAGIIAATGCGHTSDEIRVPSAEKIYNEAVSRWKGHKIFGLIPYHDNERAIELFQEVLDKFPNTKYALLSEIGIADVNFGREEYDEAQTRYRNFYTLRPANELAAYAFFRSGMCFEKLASSYDRDLTPIKNAMYEYKSLLGKYPASEYASEAKERLKEISEILAKSEFYVGKFYYRRKNYQSALNRFKNILSDYPDYSGREKVLYYLYLTYINLGEKQEAIKYSEILLNNYPDSKYRKKFAEIQSVSNNTDSTKP